MGRPATGTVVEDMRRGDVTFALRFTAEGVRRYVTLGTDAEGWTRIRAEAELSDTMALVRKGLWRPPKAAEPAIQLPREVASFHEFASAWFERQLVEGGRRGGGLTAAGAADLRWRLVDHLLPAFAHKRLDQITAEDVDRYRLEKVRERARVDEAAKAGKPLMET